MADRLDDNILGLDYNIMTLGLDFQLPTVTFGFVNST